MLQGKRFVVCGVNRLVVRVARALTERRAEVVVLRRPGDEDGLARRLPAGAQVRDAQDEEEEAALRGADLAQASCLLALGDDDLDNLRLAVAARVAAPHVPVVLRAFDPALADQLEQGLNIRRAYSVSALAAPAFLAAACGDQVVETLRLGDGEVPLCRLTVRTGSPLAGLTPPQVKARWGGAIVARRSAEQGEDGWRPVPGEGAAPLDPGEEVLVGGPLRAVLRLPLLNAGWLREGRRPWRVPRAAPARTRPAARRRPTLLMPIAGALLAVLLLAVGVFARALHLSPVDAVYFVVTTATTTGYGDISLKDTSAGLKLFGCLVMLTGGALLGILFSFLSAWATAERLDALMGRRAARMRGHVVVAGLGNLGYRLARLLSDLGVGVAVLELSPDARFAEAVRARAAVLSGDARLPENLERAGVRRAVAFVGCTNDDLANIQACLHARRLNPQAGTVARVFDDALAERLTQASFAIDAALSASGCAVSAFVGAAGDERALRPVRVGGLSLTAGRLTASAPVAPETLAGWRAQGVRVLAWREAGGPVRAPDTLPPGLGVGDEAILCGPASLVAEVIGRHSVSAPARMG